MSIIRSNFLNKKPNNNFYLIEKFFTIWEISINQGN